ncbi:MULTISPECIES: hypothetical protein [unclassified Paenibacillus]|uniref:hypothetical protein n=1 Tax=unclassified Paenibacillus TaxID=185978 RepID=UPI002781FBB1|nr:MULTISPECIES: hypothetical protein [unclassified Paenibacillus]MDQ0903743.1 hypothetical protein [Paenibacillus sp. V4I7]MDQ0917783.1 hypothetical protein [Paenibacillus sp. V4I5]
MIKMTKIAGLCILIPVLLSACGNPSTSQPAAASSAQPQQQQNGQSQADDKQNAQDRPVMNAAQRQMFSTFQTLLMLDKADGLTITKEQAQAMLPVAQEIVTKAELSDANKTKLIEKLTDAQKKFIEDSAGRMSNQGNGAANGPGNNGNTSNGKGNRNGESGNTANKPDASAQPNANAPDRTGGKNGNGNRPAGGEMRDPGKQLIELLQTKIK